MGSEGMDELKVVLQSLREQISSLPDREMIEKLMGKVDTLLINAATKVEVARLGDQMERIARQETLQELTVSWSKWLPRLVTKQEWGSLAARVEQIPTAREWQCLFFVPLKETLSATQEALTALQEEISRLHRALTISLFLHLLALIGIGWVLWMLSFP